MCFTNWARTIAFIIMAKVTHFVLPLITPRGITFTPEHGMIPFKIFLHTGKLCFWPPECCCCALFSFVFSAIKIWKLYILFWHNLYKMIRLSAASLRTHLSTKYPTGSKQGVFNVHTSPFFTISGCFSSNTQEIPLLNNLMNYWITWWTWITESTFKIYKLTQTQSPLHASGSPIKYQAI